MIDLVVPRRGLPARRTTLERRAAGRRAERAPTPHRAELAALRREVSQAAGFPVVLSSHTDPHSMASSSDPTSPRSRSRVRPRPTTSFAPNASPSSAATSRSSERRYERYFAEHAAERRGQTLKMLDPAPRVVLDPELGVVTIGRTAQDAAIAFDVYEHTIDIVLRADRARRLSRAAGRRHLRRRVLGPRAGQAAPGRQRRRSSPARSRWSPAPPRASARRPSRRSSSAARRWSGWTSTRASRTCSQRPDFLGLRVRRDGAPTDLEQRPGRGGARVRRPGHAGVERRASSRPVGASRRCRWPSGDG